MFGYISANKNELNDEDKIIYQSYYCGLCQELKALAGAKGQMLLNYDMTFLTILLSGLEELSDTEAEFTCKLHPAKKKTSRINEATEYAAAMDIILSYHSLLDDCRDEGSCMKKKLADSLRPTYDMLYTKYPRQVKAVEDYMDAVLEAEKRRETNIDIISGLTGQLMEELFDWKYDSIWSKDLRTMGFYMGKFIYILDAYEDRKKDVKKNNYNPLQYVYNEQPGSYETFCRQTLTTLMAECSKAFERLPILLHADILRNILYSGVWTKYEYQRLKDKTKEEKQKKRKNNGSI